MSEEKAKMGTGRKVLIVLICLMLLLTVAAYFIGVYYFSEHFLLGTMVNGFNCSYMKAEEAEDLLAKRAEAYVLAIQTHGNGQESISSEQIGLTYNRDGSVQKTIRQQNRFQWFLSFGKTHTYELPSTIVYDAAKLYQTVAGLKCMTEGVPSTDAYLTDTGTSFEITPETEGTELDGDQVQALIASAIVTGKTSVNLVEENCYKKPSVYRDDPDLLRQCQQANQLTDVIITYDFGDRTETVNRDLIKDWLMIENNECVLNREMVSAYVHELANKYDTFGGTRMFRTYDGREIPVSGGDYGWVIDQTAETDALIQAVSSGVTQVRTPVYQYEAWSRNTNDIGYTYIEIDLTNQRMVFYQDGYPLVDTLVVTGNPNIPGMETPVGCFALDAKQSPAVLTGEDYQANVTYWMPFCGNVGIHDATWRTQFGNNLYLWEGSHGCVNTPYEKAQAIYQNVEVGCPVVVHY